MRRRYWWGIILIIIGLWIWLSSLGVPYISFSKNWPLILVFWGLYIIIRRLTRRQRWVRRSQVISDLEQGKINVDEAVNKLKEGK
jgi:amino acid permease